MMFHPKVQINLALNNPTTLPSWHNLTKHIEFNYANPDLDAFSISLAGLVSHYDLSEKPVWLFLIGPSSTGKTELYINALKTLPKTQEISSLTEASFISRSDSSFGILPNLENRNGILLFPDFGGFLNGDPKVRAQLQNQMREIFDGKYQKHSGTSGVATVWEGKVTMYAATTPIIDRYWGLEASLGDRFMNLRINEPLPKDLVACALRRKGSKVSDRISKTQELTRKFVDLNSIQFRQLDSPDSYESIIMAMGEMVVSLRQSVFKNSKGEIDGTGDKESPSRFNNMIKTMMNTHALLFRQDEISSVQLRLARRVFMNTMPIDRFQTLYHLYCLPQAISITEFKTNFAPHINYTMLNREFHDLEILKLIQCNQRGKSKFWKPTDYCVELLANAKVKKQLLEFNKLEDHLPD